MARNRVLQYEKNMAYGEMMGRFVYRGQCLAGAEWEHQQRPSGRALTERWKHLRKRGETQMPSDQNCGLVCDEWQQLWHLECLLVFQTLV